MHTPETAPLHPLLKVAAASVIVASAAVVANLAGWWPAGSQDSAPVATASTPPLAEAAPPAPAAPLPPPVVTAPAAPPVVTMPEPAPVVRPRAPASAPLVCHSCGTVQRVSVVTEKGESTGAGAVTGAVLGGVAGHQMGKGRGKDAMTVVGAIGGALAGDATEKAMRKKQYYEVTVLMENGSVQNFHYQSIPPFSAGDAVRVDGGMLQRR